MSECNPIHGGMTMKIKSIKIHNFRSIKDAFFNLDNYSVLLGENNAGKSNIISAIRIFYEDGLRFTDKTDFPKFTTDDNESWIEIEYNTTEEEQLLLNDEYKTEDKVLKVRKYLKSDNGYVQVNQSNIYAYEKGELSANLFYGAKNISQAKLGKIVYIPEISKVDDNMKLSGPSPFRNMITFVMNKVIKNSGAYKKLEEGFLNFNKDFQEEKTIEGLSFNKLVEDINSDISSWDVNFNIDINPISPEDITKNLISHYLEDNNLKDQRISIDSFGQGLQRHLIYTLIKLSAQYVDSKATAKKVFSPDLTLILFEEPEVFLHPSQQEFLNISLRQLSENDDQQVLITTHSPIFVSKNILNLTSLIKVRKESCLSYTRQIRATDYESLCDNNLELYRLFLEKYEDPVTPQELKKELKKYVDRPSTIRLLEEESIKYFLWLDSERAGVFFAKHVIICEGATEKCLFDYLINTEWIDLKERHIYFLDSMGKFNVNRYMNLFSRLGIKHSVLIDKDKNMGVHNIVNDLIQQTCNGYTVNCLAFEEDLESFCGIERTATRLKPLNIIYNVQNNNIPKTKIDELKEIIINLLD